MIKPESALTFEELDDHQLYMIDSAASGMTTVEISRESGLSVNACARYFWRLYKRLGVHSRDEMIARYNDWLNEEESENARDHRKTA